MRVLTFLLVIFSFSVGFSQNEREIEIIDSLKQVVQSTSDDSIRVMSVRLIAVNFRKFDFDSAEWYAAKAVSMADKNGDLFLRGRTQSTLGWVAYEQAHYSEAYTHYEEARKLLLQAGELKEAAKNHNSTGLCFWRRGQYTTAIEVYTALSLYLDSIDFPEYKVAPLINIAVINEELGLPETALDYYRQAHDLGLEVEDDRAIMISLNNMSSIYRGQGDFITSNAMLWKSISVAGKNDNDEMVCRGYANLGANYVQMGERDSALAFLMTADSLHRLTNIPSSEVKLDWHIGELYLTKKQYAQARNWTMRSRDLALKYDMIRDIKLAYQQLYKIEKGDRQIEEAVRMGDSLIYWSDTLAALNLESEIAEAQTKYETRLLELENAVSHAQIEKLTAEKQKLTIGFIIGLVVLLLLGLAFYLYRQQRLSKEKLETEERYAQQMLLQLEAYKKRISSNLHDDIGQQLIMAIQLLDKGDGVEQGLDLVRETLSRIRSLSRDEYPYQVEHVGLEVSLEDLIDSVEKNSNIIFSESIEGIPKYFSKAFSLHIYRIMQECINNTLKYAKASSVFIGLLKKGQALEITFLDNGKPFDFYQNIKKRNAMGLKQIHDRVRIMNGKLLAVPSIKEGNKYIITIPITDAK